MRANSAILLRLDLDNFSGGEHIDLANDPHSNGVNGFGGIRGIIAKLLCV